MTTENSKIDAETVELRRRPDIKWKVQLDALCAQSPKARLMLSDLREIQARLGSPAERLDDKTRAGEIAHELNNILCGITAI